MMKQLRPGDYAISARLAALLAPWPSAAWRDYAHGLEAKTAGMLSLRDTLGMLGFISVSLRSAGQRQRIAARDAQAR
jgi:hypothetical protein